ncbi:MAG: class I SAM-dependent methyltransferase [Opitutales bacterium]|nr:class I SAM-dependent methyltransferase [Opitutales bacterium]
MNSFFEELTQINKRPCPFEYYTADELWTDHHTADQMLDYHLNGSIDLSSRNSAFIESSIKWIASRFGLNQQSKVADFGCGPGLYTTALAEYGASVTGIDFSRNSIDYAEKTAMDKNLKIKYIHQNYLDFDTNQQFDIITMIMCDFCALSPEQRGKMLGKFHKLLTAEGHVLLDVYSLSSFEKKKEAFSYELNHLNGFWSSDDYYCFVNTFKYEEEKVYLDKYTIVEESRMRKVYNWLQHYSKESIIAEFETYGFVIDELYSNVAGKPFDSSSDEIAVVARKR